MLPVLATVKLLFVIVLEADMVNVLGDFVFRGLRGRSCHGNRLRFCDCGVNLVAFGGKPITAIVYSIAFSFSVLNT